MKKEKIVIVGAGISGLYLAFLLQEKYDITILEARDRIGGRIYSIGGHDMGPSWVWQHHKNILELIEKFDLQLFLQYEKGYALYDTQNIVEKFMPQQNIPSARVDGTLSKLIDTLYTQLKDVTIVLNSEVIAIKKQENILIKTKTKEYTSDYAISTLPPRIAQNLSFIPPLPTQLQDTMKNTQTWMGNSAKCVIEFKTSFWREKGLSGFVFSNIGPLAEIHDASTRTKNALFGFVKLKVDTNNYKKELIEQLQRVFSIEESEILAIHLVDWKREKYTSTKEDFNTMASHPNYGIDTTAYSDKILFSSTEFSFEQGGYIEGAIVQAKKIFAKLI